MRHRAIAATLLGAMVSSLLQAIPTIAADVHTDIVVEIAWARASAGPARNGAAYVTLRGNQMSDSLIGVTSEAAEKAELHTHINDGNVMKMRHVEAISVDAGAIVKMAPGGLHIMLMGLKAPLIKGTTLPLTLIFAKGGDVRVNADILAPGSRGPAGHQSGGHGDMDGMNLGK